MGLYVLGAGLLAGGVAGSLSKPDKPKRRSILTDEQQVLFNQVLSEFEGGPSGVDIGKFIGGKGRGNAFQKLAFAQASDLQRNGLPLQDLRNVAIAGQIVGAPGFTADPEQRAQLFQEQVTDPALQQFDTRVIPRLQEAYAARGLGRSGDFSRGLQRAGSELSTNLAAASAGFLREDEDRNFASRENAAARVPQGLALGATEATFPINLGLQVGGQQATLKNQFLIDKSLRGLASRNFAFNPESSYLPFALSPTSVYA